METSDASANDFKRNFVLSFFLEDDTASVFEPPEKNGGNGGKFLERGKIRDSQTGKAYSTEDMFVGNVQVAQAVLQVSRSGRVYVENARRGMLLKI